jgi:hypothetical protein
MGGHKKLFTVGVIGALLALPASAIAQSSQGGYNQPGGVVQDQIQAQPAQAQDQVQATPTRVTAAAPSNNSAQLPFTGLDLALVVGAGGLLLLLGLGIRRFTRASDLA